MPEVLVGMDEFVGAVFGQRFPTELEGGHNRTEAQLAKEERIASFTSRVEEVEEWQREVQRGCISWTNTYSAVRKKQSQTRNLSALLPISANALEQNKTHKGSVLYCRSVVRCMYMNSLSTLVEDASGQLVSLQVYNIRDVKTIWDAQAWLPEGTALAIVEPFYKTRADGTLGIRADNPQEVVLNVTGPASIANGCKPASPCVGHTSIVRASVEERLASLANEGFGQKRLHKQLREEGYEISENAVRQKLRACKEQSGAVANAGSSESARLNQACVRSPSENMRCSEAETGSNNVNDEASSPDATHSTTATIRGVPTIGTKVVAQALQSDAAKHLNGQEGIVVGQDLTTLRALVDFGGAGEKAVRFENLRLVHATASQLPSPRLARGDACLSQGSNICTSLSHLLSEERWAEAIVFGQCLDMAFLSHSMPVELLHAARASASFPRCLITVVEAIVEACRKRQLLASSSGPAEMEDPSSILPLCTESIAATSNTPSSLNHSAACFLRGVVHGSMQDWQAAAADYQAAYVASDGQMPWILPRAGWCTVSSTDGLPMVQIQQNDAAAQQLYEVFLHYLDQLGKCDSDNKQSLLVFSLWELAFVCQMRGQRLHPIFSKMYSAVCSEGPPAQVSPAKAQTLFQKALGLKDRALIAEKGLRKKGIMNSHARDAVLRNGALFAMAQSRTNLPRGVAQPSSERSANNNEAAMEHETQSRLSNHQQMQGEEVERMDREKEALDSGDIMSTMLLRMKEQAVASKQFEEGMKNRRRDIAARTEALIAREDEFRRRDSQMTEQQTKLVKEADKVRDDKHALNSLYQQEKQRQEENFQAELVRLREEHDVEIADIQSQLVEAAQQRDQQQNALLEDKRQAEQALEELLGVQEAEADRWQREVRANEAQISADQASLQLQSQQLAKMQADVAEKSRLLDQKDQQLKKERQMQQQFEAEGTLSHEMLGNQQSGRREVRLCDIRFSQDSICSAFRAGGSVKQAAEDLMSGKIQITDFPTIRVVQLFHGIFWSLDNRRLRCMQIAFAKQKNKMIHVQVESLQDKKVKSEFHRKFTAGKDIVQR